MPKGVTWTEPEGGFSCWLTLPAGFSSGDLYAAALERGLVVTPGEVFQVEPGAHAHLRLCFGNRSENEIREGVEILAGLIRARLETGTRRRRVARGAAPLV